MQIADTVKYSVFLVSLSLSTLGLASTTANLAVSQPTPPTEAMTLPSSGTNMQQVASVFGQPAEKLPSIGKPPITTWRYADFNVYFENQRVLHSVRFVPYVRPMQLIVE